MARRALAVAVVVPVADEGEDAGFAIADVAVAALAVFREKGGGAGAEEAVFLALFVVFGNGPDDAALFPGMGGHGNEFAFDEFASGALVVVGGDEPVDGVVGIAEQVALAAEADGLLLHFDSGEHFEGIGVGGEAEGGEEGGFGGDDFAEAGQMKDDDAGGAFAFMDFVEMMDGGADFTMAAPGVEGAADSVDFGEVGRFDGELEDAGQGTHRFEAAREGEEAFVVEGLEQEAFALRADVGGEGFEGEALGAGAGLLGEEGGRGEEQSRQQYLISHSRLL